MNDEFEEKEVTVSMPKRVKYEYIRHLHKELEQGHSNDAEVFKMISQNQMKLIQVKTKKGENLPKKALSVSEFNAIRSHYSGLDFERNSLMPMSGVVTCGVLWFVQRFFTKMKWRI